MKKILLLVALCAPLASKPTPLVAGQKYDFIATDGQHIYDAQLVKETPTAYVVKPDSLGEEIVQIEKSVLSGPPRPSAGKKTKDTLAGRSSRKWNMSLGGEIRMASGAFADYAQFFPGFSFRLSTQISPVPYLRFNQLAAWLQYAPIARSPRRIDMLTLAAGPKWTWRFRKLPRAEFYAFAAPTLSEIYFKSYTFSTWSTNLGFMAVGGADWSLGSNVVLTAALGTHYVHDKSTLVLMHMFSLGAGYAW